MSPEKEAFWKEFHIFIGYSSFSVGNHPNMKICHVFSLALDLFHGFSQHELGILKRDKVTKVEGSHFQCHPWGCYVLWMSDNLGISYIPKCCRISVSRDLCLWQLAKTTVWFDNSILTTDTLSTFVSCLQWDRSSGKQVFCGQGNRH